MKKTLLISLLAMAAGAHAQTWKPLSSGAKSRSADITTSSLFGVPQSIARSGGTIRFLLVGGGQGGSASQTACTEPVLQGGKGGDGGEVIEVDVTLSPGQYTQGIAVQIGRGGRGSFRAGYGSVVGEVGGTTTISCNGTILAAALGGGARPTAGMTTKTTKGGDGGVIFNTLQSTTNTTFDQRSMNVKQATDGGSGLYGFGSGGGGGGVSQTLTGFRVGQDSTSAQVTQVFNAPSGKGGHGGGNGGGPSGYPSSSPSIATENAAQFGAGGGGGATQCAGGAIGTDGGNGFQGLVRAFWQE